MGIRMGSNYANLFVGYIEKQIFDRFNGPRPELYGRFIDGCFGATFAVDANLISSLNMYNLFTRLSISETSVSFLDINVSVSDSGLATTVHYKPTDSHSYLLHSSSHPSHVKNSNSFLGSAKLISFRNSMRRVNSLQSEVTLALLSPVH